MAGSPFDFHRAEPSQQPVMTTPPLDVRRAESSRQHVRALNTQFARSLFYSPQQQCFHHVLCNCFTFFLAIVNLRICYDTIFNVQFIKMFSVCISNDLKQYHIPIGYLLCYCVSKLGYKNCSHKFLAMPLIRMAQLSKVTMHDTV